MTATPTPTTATAYFVRNGSATFTPTEHSGGAWNTEELHVAPALGLMVHTLELELDLHHRPDAALTRLSYDILGPIALGPLEVAARVVRPGRTVELLEATLAQGGRPAVVLRAWLQRGFDTASLAQADFDRLVDPHDMEPWDPTTVWDGGFIASVEIRRDQKRPGRAQFWARPLADLLAGEPVSELARAAGLFDVANGMTVLADPATTTFPNLDLTAHVVGPPSNGWLGFDTTVACGMNGVGVTHSIVHNAQGPFATLAQCLTVRPGPPAS